MLLNDKAWLTLSFGRTGRPSRIRCRRRANLAFGRKTARGLLCTGTGTFTMFTTVTRCWSFGLLAFCALPNVFWNFAEE
jgi:hypothetical protein